MKILSQIAPDTPPQVNNGTVFLSHARPAHTHTHIHTLTHSPRPILTSKPQAENDSRHTKISKRKSLIPPATPPPPSPPAPEDPEPPPDVNANNDGESDTESDTTIGTDGADMHNLSFFACLVWCFRVGFPL